MGDILPIANNGRVAGGEDCLETRSDRERGSRVASLCRNVPQNYPYTHTSHLFLCEVPTPFFLYPLQARVEQNPTHGLLGLQDEYNIIPT